MDKNIVSVLVYRSEEILNDFWSKSQLIRSSLDVFFSVHSQITLCLHNIDCFSYAAPRHEFVNDDNCSGLI